MKTVSCLSGQTFVEVTQEDGGSRLVPANKWIELQLVQKEIDLTFNLIADIRQTEKDTLKFEEIVRWLITKLVNKYGERWPELLEDYTSSPAAGRILAKIEINNILNN